MNKEKCISGGTFNYQQYAISYIADSIDKVLNGVNDEYNFSKETIAKFIETKNELNLVAKKVQRIDWLLADDDEEDSFHKRWEEEGL